MLDHQVAGLGPTWPASARRQPEIVPPTTQVVERHDLPSEHKPRVLRELPVTAQAPHATHRRRTRFNDNPNDPPCGTRPIAPLSGQTRRYPAGSKLMGWSSGAARR